jgi:hypothetical protein
MPFAAICSNIFLATGREVAAAMTVSISDTGEELMTRRQVAYLFRATSAAVARWARSGLLPEVRDGAGRPRYRRTSVEELFRSGFRLKPR